MSGSDRAATLKETIPISSIVGERVQLRRRGQYFSGCCPFHDDSIPSFWANDETGRFGCFGCDIGGDLIDFVREYEGCSFLDALDQLDAGYVPAPWPSRTPCSVKEDAQQRVRHAHKIWVDAKPIEGTPAEACLASRALRLENLPELLNLRFARLPFERSASRHPVLLAAVQTVNGMFAGVQRTYLTEDGNKLEVHNAKRSLGTLRGNVIRIGHGLVTEPLVYVCEGLEDGLSLARMYDDGPVLVAAGAGMMKFVDLPSESRRVIIGADNDASGLKAAEEAAATFRTQGVEAFILRPDWRHKDWNEHVKFWDTRTREPEGAGMGWARG